MESVPPGFRQRMRGLGWTEISFQGNVEMEAENNYPQPDGSILTVPSYRVVGTDPVPLGEGMHLDEANIHALGGQADGTSHSPFTVLSPDAWIPLVQDQERFAFDMNRLWQLEDPVFEMPDFHQGRPLRIETAHADMDPETDQVFGRGPFLLVSGDLRLEGADIFFDPATSRVEFQPLDGLLRWSIRSKQGAVFRGSCDGPGAFSPNPEGGYRLEFHPTDEVSTFFPADSVMPGTLHTSDMTLHLMPDSGGSWQPDSATAEGPTDWQGQTLRMTGEDSAMAWRDGGELEHLTVFGPVEVHPTDDSFEAASAKGSARFQPASETVRLEEDVIAEHARGVLQGDWAELGPERWEVGGSVHATGEEGEATADQLTTDRQGNWALRGNAEIMPKDGQVDWVRSPEVLFDESGRVSTGAGFVLQATVDGQPLFASGEELDSRLVRGRTSDSPKVRRTEAKGSLFVEHQGRRLRGSVLEQTGDAAFRLLGNPDRGERVTGSATIGEVPVVLDCGRLSWDGQEVTVEDAPMLEVPATSLGLAGDVVQVRARRFLQHAQDGTWELRDDVRCKGALEGNGSSALWTPGRDLVFLAEGRDADGQPARASVKGSTTDGQTFQARGTEIRYQESGRLSVSEDAYLSFLQPHEEIPAELWGDQVELGETSGWALGQARFQTSDASGAAGRIDWTRYPGEGDLLLLVDDASITRGQVMASGPHLEVDTRADTITCIGSEDLPATLRAEDGRTAVGLWLRYHLSSGRFESRGARFETP
jgi:hypothetical protein